MYSDRMHENDTVALDDRNQYQISGKKGF